MAIINDSLNCTIGRLFLSNIAATFTINFVLSFSSKTITVTLSVPAATAGGEDSDSVPVRRLASRWSALSPQPAPGASGQSPQEPEIHREQARGSHVQVGAACVVLCYFYVCVTDVCVFICV